MKKLLIWLAVAGPVIGKMALAALEGFDNYQRLSQQDQNLIEN